MLPTEFFGLIDCKGAIISITMDEFNREGLVGTEAGQIFYINFADRMDVEPFPIVSSVNQNQDAVKVLKYETQNAQSCFVSGCGQRSGELKLFSSETCDKVRGFHSDHAEEGHVVFFTDLPTTRTKIGAAHK